MRAFSVVTSLFYTVLLLCVYFGTQTVITALFAVLHGTALSQLPTDPTLLIDSTVWATIVAVPLTLAVLVILVRRHGFSLRTYLALHCPQARHWVIAVLLFIFYIVLEVLVQLPKSDTSSFAEKLLLPASVPLTALIAFGIAAPVLEEVLFRGFLFSALERTRLGTWGAILVPALFFALLHIQYTPATMAVLLLFGVGLGWLRHYTGSLIVPLVLHVCNNLLAFAALFLLS